MSEGGDRSVAAPQYQRLFTFSKMRDEILARERRRFRLMSVGPMLLGATCLGCMVFTLVTSGGVGAALFMGAPLLACGFAWSLARAKLQGLRELDVDVSYCRQTKMVRFDSHPSMSVELSASELLALATREEPLEAVTVRQTRPRASFALVAQTKTGDVTIARPLVCTGANYIAMGREYLAPALADAFRRIEVAAQ